MVLRLKATVSRMRTPDARHVRMVLTLSHGRQSSRRFSGGASALQVMSLLFRGTFTARVNTAETTMPQVDAARSQNSTDLHCDRNETSQISADKRGARVSGGMK